MQDLQQLLKTTEYIKAKEALDDLTVKFRGERVDYSVLNVRDGGFWVYYSDVEGWEEKAADEFLNKVCLDLAKYNVKPLTPKWWRLIARFTREYWRHKVPPHDWTELERATKCFDYLQICADSAKARGAKTLEITVQMIDTIYDWFCYLKALIVKK